MRESRARKRGKDGSASGGLVAGRRERVPGWQADFRGQGWSRRSRAYWRRGVMDQQRMGGLLSTRCSLSGWPEGVPSSSHGRREEGSGLDNTDRGLACGPFVWPLISWDVIQPLAALRLSMNVSRRSASSRWDSRVWFRGGASPPSPCARRPWTPQKPGGSGFMGLFWPLSHKVSHVEMGYSSGV